MKKSRKLMMVLLAVLIIAMIPTTAFAKKAKKAGKGGKWYVPTAGTEYEWDKQKNDWVPVNRTFEAKFDNKGRVKTLTYTSVQKDTLKVQAVDSYTFAWKGDLLSKETNVDADYDDQGRVHGTTYETSYKYKGKKLSKYNSSSVTTNVNGAVTGTSSTKGQYSWGSGKKNNVKGSYAGEWDNASYDDKGGLNWHNAGRSADEITLKKGKVSSSWNSNTTYKYYANGNLKSARSKYTSDDGSALTYHEDVREFNKAGFLVKSTSNWFTEAHKQTKYEETYDPEYGWDYKEVTVDVPAKSGWSSTTYTWHMNGKKPESVEWGTVYSEGEPSTPMKWVFTNIQKVKLSRNCDAFGNQLWLGLWT